MKDRVQDWSWVAPSQAYGGGTLASSPCSHIEGSVRGAGESFVKGTVLPPGNAGWCVFFLGSLEAIQPLGHQEAKVHFGMLLKFI